MTQYINGRSKWGARIPQQIVTQTPGSVHTLVVHHTVGRAPFTRSGAKREMRRMQKEHMDANGWSDIGYNVVIDRWGRMWEGRGLNRVGAHTYMHNTGTIGVSFMGNYENIRLTKRQLQAFKNLKALLGGHGFGRLEVLGHRQMPNQATACPGRHIMSQLKLPNTTH